MRGADGPFGGDGIGVPDAERSAMVTAESMEIEVEPYGIPVVGHKSFGEAINAGLPAPVALRAKADSALIAGQRVVEACG